LKVESKAEPTGTPVFWGQLTKNLDFTH